MQQMKDLVMTDGTPKRSYANTRFPRMNCPHCGMPCTGTRTKQISPTYREITYQCANESCDFIFVAALSPIKALHPSRIPDPDIAIPLSEHARQAANKA